ncbi:hypothetical protein WOLCODRAFT_152768 [Wolfiporia cocos MD-104 SS10]|uniref:Uncharacterized protein n=1 Tax=Wolfiporia cocos (strain MD-104) TaxID=742152 RepID=A0A2H3JKL2_WOLCO|nr:hypothetical protein WOLCODRAFT_152768 [Wolfiporia cocos MD-104 SS10]
MRDPGFDPGGGQLYVTTAILHTNNALRWLKDEQRMMEKDTTKKTDKGKAWVTGEKRAPPTPEVTVQLAKWKCNHCEKMQGEEPNLSKCKYPRWHNPYCQRQDAQSGNSKTGAGGQQQQQTRALTDGEPQVLSEIPQEDFVRMVATWAQANPKSAKQARFNPTQVTPSPRNKYAVLDIEESKSAMDDDELGDRLYGLDTGAPDIVSLSVYDSDDDDGASTCSDDSFVTALEEPPLEAQWEANTVLNSSNVTYVPMEVDPVDSDMEMAAPPESQSKKKTEKKQKHR